MKQTKSRNETGGGVGRRWSCRLGVSLVSAPLGLSSPPASAGNVKGGENGKKSGCLRPPFLFNPPFPLSACAWTDASELVRERGAEEERTGQQAARLASHADAAAGAEGIDACLDCAQSPTYMARLTGLHQRIRQGATRAAASAALPPPIPSHPMQAFYLLYYRAKRFVVQSIYRKSPSLGEFQRRFKH